MRSCYNMSFVSFLKNKNISFSLVAF